MRGLSLRWLGADGTLPAGPALTGTTNIYGTLHHTTLVDCADGTHVVYGGLAGQGGLTQQTFDDTGALMGRRTVADLNRTFGADIAGTASATVDGTTYLYTASGTENGISTWSVAANGNLFVVHDMGHTEGLWISTPLRRWPARRSAGGPTWCSPLPAPPA